MNTGIKDQMLEIAKSFDVASTDALEAKMENSFFSPYQLGKLGKYHFLSPFSVYEHEWVSVITEDESWN